MSAAHIKNPSENLKTADSFKYAVIVAAVAVGTALGLAIFLRSQNIAMETSDPYGYGQSRTGFIEHGFTKLTRRAASLYPEFLAVVYRLGGSDLVVILLQCLFHAATCVLVFS